MNVAVQIDPAVAVTRAPVPAFANRGPERSVMAQAAMHSLAWLVFANVIGVWLAVLLLYPHAGTWLAPWSYGRWMPVHLDLQLYGWISLPLVGWLFRVYRTEGPALAPWSRAALLLWSASLFLGSFSWLNGETSGKLFLDWSGYVRVFFPACILFLWAVLAAGLVREFRGPAASSAVARAGKLLGLAILLPIPFAIYLACNPAIYPPVNPDSGGPTGASQLESVLIVVLILFLLPYGLSAPKGGSGRWVKVGWIVFGLECLLSLGLGHGNISDHRPTQYLALGSLLVWVPLMPAYYSAFLWSERTRRWRIAMLAWWALLIPTGWFLFLPGILDRLKFTDGLVGHSLLAMAGFVSAVLLFVLVVLLGDDAEAFDAAWSFYAWNVAALLYVAIMVYAGWIEGADPAFTMVPGRLRNVIYAARLVLGIVMTVASADWLIRLGADRNRRLLTDPLAAYGRLPKVAQQ
jgi:cytochrome c oxidase cbb3-type subunit 1